MSPTSPAREPRASAIERLLDTPQRYEFHQAVRLLHVWLRRQPEEGRPVLRFRNTLSLSFPASEIASLEVHRPPGPSSTEPDTDAQAQERPPGRIELTPAFMGLLGIGGALPLSYSEQFARREAGAGGSDVARSFLDIFQNRGVTLFHEAWRKFRLPLQFEADREQRYLPLVLSLAGLGEPALRQRLRGKEGGVADDALAFYAGLLQRRAVSAGHLRRVLADYFGVPVRVEQFVGRWFELQAPDQVTLGVSEARLGLSTLVGPRVWQRDLRVRLRIGPLTRAQHRRFLPGGSAALALRELLTLVSGVSLEYEVRLSLRADEVFPAILHGTPQALGEGPRLGWDSLLHTVPCDQDREDPVYDIHALAA